MGDLISRDALLEFAHNHVNGTVDCNDIARFPAVDAEPVRRGRWMDTPIGVIKCSECGLDINMNKELAHYCPSCGSKMCEGGLANGNN